VKHGVVWHNACVVLFCFGSEPRGQASFRLIVPAPSTATVNMTASDFSHGIHWVREATRDRFLRATWLEIQFFWKCLAIAGQRLDEPKGAHVECLSPGGHVGVK
jgi:hypothetical protein